MSLTATFNDYTKEKIIHENSENGIVCGIGKHPEKGECFIKIINYGSFSDQRMGEKCLENAKTEAETLEMLAKIPAVKGKVPALYDVCHNRSRGQFVIVMERMKGQTLRQWMDAHPVSNMDQKGFFARRMIVLQICQIMYDIYKKYTSIIHRDLKPENIMIRLSDGRWVVSVVDFGCARLNFARKMGTVGYCAPEQDELFCKKLTASYGPHTDLFAIGQIYYELLLGEVQHFGEHYLADLRKKDWEKRPSLPEKLLGFPNGQQIDDLLNKMTTFDPDKRKYDISYERALATLRAKRR